MIEIITIPARFNGPPTSGNGGYCAGLAARFVDGQAEATLRAPPPLETPLRVEAVEAGVDILDGETVVIQARPRAPLARPDIAPPSLDLAQAAASTFRSAEDHLLPTCFVCGPARKPGDGLRIFTDFVEGRRDLVAAPWTPTPDLAADDGKVAETFLWAALDCPGAFAVDVQPILLGRLAANILDRPAPGDPLVVAGWPRGSDGRKHHAGTALFSADGDLLAHAEATWIQLTRPHGAA